MKAIKRGNRENPYCILIEFLLAFEYMIEFPTTFMNHDYRVNIFISSRGMKGRLCSIVMKSFFFTLFSTA